MPCPRCKAEFTILKSTKLISDKINVFGRRELNFEAESENPVGWTGDHYHCSKCGLDFSPKEHSLQIVGEDQP